MSLNLWEHREKLQAVPEADLAAGSVGRGGEEDKIHLATWAASLIDTTQTPASKGLSCNYLCSRKEEAKSVSFLTVSF